ncbi:translation initiation factor 2 [Halorubrum rubrum]|uniref:Translation initiation factor 2 n=1 Tax=Halorubrum rubrum TaxID=1126240 RepID=A0ABD5R5H5_9EURY|nr:translation initiation factor 2 [Halorubrum rubrum]
MTAVVSAFVRHRAAVCCVRRRDDAETDAGRLDVVSGEVRSDATDPVEDVRRALRAAMPDADLDLVRRGEPLSVAGEGTERTVHPFLFEAAGRDPPAHRSPDAVEWLPPTAFLTRETVPGLWERYRRVAPDVDAIRTDEVHGAAWLSLRALEVLRDAAGVVAFGAQVNEGAEDGEAEDRMERVRGVARDLRDARPSMIVVRNRVDRVMDAAAGTPRAVHDRAVDALDDAFDADRRAAERAADAIADAPGRVATLSRSGTVADAIRAAGRAAVVGESRPAREGVTAAERLAADGVDVALTTDAALPGRVRDGDVGCVLLGADRVLPTGDAANKVGSYPLALAAADADVPAYVVAAADKVAAETAVVAEAGDPSAVYDGDAAVSVENPVFERVPGDLLRGVVTEEGILDRDAIAARARDHERRSAWVERVDSDDVE